MRTILRIIIALIFIASGFVKAVDAVGFSFKLEEYFSPSVFNMPIFEELALPIAIFVVALELILGFMLLLGIRLRTTLLSLIALCVFFAFLTFYSAYFNKVTDCGCFGDAIKFTPWQSFLKDIILLAGLIILWFLYRKDFRQLKTGKLSTITLGVLAAVMAWVTVHGIRHEPVIDFRHYKIGTDINAERKKIDANPSVYKTFYSLKNKQTGEVLEINQDDFVSDKKYWEEGTPWEIQEDLTTTKMVQEGYASEIVKFRIEDENGNDLVQQILQAPNAVILFAYDPKNIDPQIAAAAEAKIEAMPGTYILGVSTDISTFRTLPAATMDGVAIKTIARSNPFVLVLQHGKITDKKSAKDFLND